MSAAAVARDLFHGRETAAGAAPRRPPRWHLCWRNITGATDQRTLIAAILPRDIALSSTAPRIALDLLTARRHFAVAAADESDDACMAAAAAAAIAALNSLPVDYAARIAAGGTHLDYHHLRQLPIPPPALYLERSPQGARWIDLILPRVARLVCSADELAPFAADLGTAAAPYRWDEGRRLVLRCEIDAMIAAMLGLDRGDLEDLLGDFRELGRAEERRWGERRTERLALEAWDALARGEMAEMPR